MKTIWPKLFIIISAIIFFLFSYHVESSNKYKKGNKNDIIHPKKLLNQKPTEIKITPDSGFIKNSRLHKKYISKVGNHKTGNKNSGKKEKGKWKQKKVAGSISEFKQKYHFEIITAKDLFHKIEKEFIKQSSLYGTDYRFLSAIVFPELIRYSVYRDFFETEALEIFYIREGSKAADFSIGIFQIKPSFVETLEKKVAKDSLNDFLFITGFVSDNKEEIRKERLNRLKNINWQITYINCFYKIMENIYANMKFASINQKLIFYATAYNHGFNSSAEDIKKWQKIKSFPHGLKSNEINYNYSEISQFFYNQL